MESNQKAVSVLICSGLDLELSIVEIDLGGLEQFDGLNSSVEQASGN